MPSGKVGVEFGMAAVSANGDNTADSNDRYGTDAMKFYVPVAVSGVNLKPQFSIHPNPAQQRLNIVLQDGGLMDVYVAAMNGALHKVPFTAATTGNYTVDISALSAGTYQLIVETKAGVGSRLFVRQ
jgi:hypothetical protein